MKAETHHGSAQWLFSKLSEDSPESRTGAHSSYMMRQLFTVGCFHLLMCIIWCCPYCTVSMCREWSRHDCRREIDRYIERKSFADMMSVMNYPETADHLSTVTSTTSSPLETDRENWLDRKALTSMVVLRLVLSLTNSISVQAWPITGRPRHNLCFYVEALLHQRTGNIYKILTSCVVRFYIHHQIK